MSGVVWKVMTEIQSSKAAYFIKEKQNKIIKNYPNPESLEQQEGVKQETAGKDIHHVTFVTFFE